MAEHTPPADLAALRADHKRMLTHGGTAWCLECDDFWPCPPAHLLTALDGALAVLRRGGGVPPLWQAAIEILEGAGNA